MSKIPAFVYWEDIPGLPRPGYIDLCAQTHSRHLAEDFELVRVTRDNVRELVPDLPEAVFDIRPDRIANSISLETRGIALFTGVLRAFLLHRHGGMWVDADVIALRRFTPVLEQLETHEFVGSVNGVGGVTNAFFAVRPGSRILDAYVAAIRSKLAAKTTLQWGELGFQMLTRHVQKMPAESRHLFRVGSAILFPWTQARQFFETGVAAVDVIRPETFAAILFNNGMSREIRDMPPEQMLAADYLVSDLFRTALGKSLTP